MLEGSGRRAARLAASLVAGAALWLTPPPAGLAPEPWRLFAVFAATILAILLDALPILTAALLGLATAVLTRVLAPADAYEGFRQGPILLIVAAFLIARSVLKSGLGARIGHWVVARFGSTTLGLGYSLFLIDALIAPAFPSNTARSGALYPLALSLAANGDSRPDDGTANRMGSYFMLCGITSISVSSGLWLTAMVANPVGAELARARGVDVTFASWLATSIVPSLVALALLPWFVYRLKPPEVTRTPEAPRRAREALAAMGAPSREERWVAAIFGGIVVAWAGSSVLGLDNTAIAFLGLGLLLASGVFSAEDLRGEGEALGTFIWFAALYGLATGLEKTGFTAYASAHLSHALLGLPWPTAYALLILLYVALHYLFVSQTAQLMALAPLFLGVGAELGVPAPLIAFGLLFASNYFSALTPQASGANVLFAASGYLEPRDIYRVGGLSTALLVAILFLVGTPWILFVWGAK
ncbi:MAG TPA: DASS family sodium-coupled anion symporter [Myxococcota bacterium]|nr:DASS family sodium-coupled anion symporter [Myxococcota bacterium]